MIQTLKPIPEIGKQYHFFDDGKVSYSRHSMAMVVAIIPVEEAKHKTFINWSHEPIDENAGTYLCEKTVESLYDIWQTAVEEIDWVFSEETDCFICCAIPEYDNNLIYFARTHDGGWFSLDIQSSWQGGRLDVTGEIYQDLEITYKIMENPIIQKFTVLIMETRKAGDKAKVEVLQSIKAKLTEFITQKNAPTLDDNAAITLMQKMKKERQQDIEMFKEGNRADLIDKTLFEISVLDEFIPAEATEEDVKKHLDQLATCMEFTQKNMGLIIKDVKGAFKVVDGAMVAKLVKERING